MTQDDLGDHKPREVPLEELARLPLNELEDYADNLIGHVTLSLPPSEVAAICTALVANLAEPEPTGPKGQVLRRKMEAAFNRVMNHMAQNKED